MSSPASRDVMVVLGDLVDESSPTAEPSSKKTAALRFRDNVVEPAVLQPVKEGEALHGEVVRLKPRSESHPITEHTVGAHLPAFDVEVMYRAPESAHASAPRQAAAPENALFPTGNASGVDGARPGPARVSNPTYRSNYSRVFGDKKKTLN